MGPCPIPPYVVSFFFERSHSQHTSTVKRKHTPHTGRERFRRPEKRIKLSTERGDARGQSGWPCVLTSFSSSK